MIIIPLTLEAVRKQLEKGIVQGFMLVVKVVGYYPIVFILAVHFG